MTKLIIAGSICILISLVLLFFDETGFLDFISGFLISAGVCLVLLGLIKLRSKAN